MTTLYRQRQEKITLVEAIKACQQCFHNAVGLLYSPESCFLSQVNGTDVTGSNGQAIKLDRVFEARIFNAGYEMRWLNQQGGQGIAVLLSEQIITSYLANSVDTLEVIDTQEQTYLLWGEGSTAGNLADGWSQLSTSRIGKLDVPIANINLSNQRIKLTTIEYFSQMGNLDGNVIVAEERLTGLQKVLS
jgi:CRISPR-associated protein (TIGR03984 family)